MTLPTERRAVHADLHLTRSALEEMLSLDPTQQHFERCVFDGEDLGGLDLSGAVFDDCSLLRTRLDRTVLCRTQWRGCRGPGASFELADIADAKFSRCDLSNTQWRRAKLSSTAFDEVKLTGASFTEARTLGLQLHASLLVSADLRGFSFRKQTLTQLNFSSADVSGCDFTEAVLVDCDLTDANLKHAKFARADLRRARLGAVQVGDLLQHFKGSVISVDQAAALIAALGVQVV